MTSTGLPPPRLIQDSTEFQRLVKRLAQETQIAIDTESNSLYAYQEQVCLIQFSTSEDDFILDTLGITDLDALAPVLADPGIEKVFHAAEYDLICLKRDYGFRFNNLFDTMIAARTLGWKKVGLANILKEQFGVSVNKRFQRSDWGRRPLTAGHLAYARLDTHYLIPLRNALHAELLAAGRWEEAREEFERTARASDGRPSAGGYDPHGFWRIGGVRDLDPRQVAVLRELHRYRDGVARRLDRPPFKVMGDKTLLAVARNLPLTVNTLKKLPGMTPGQVRRHQRGILEAVRKGKQATPPRRPRAQRVPEDVLARYEALRTWRKNRAARRGVESDVIVPREVLWELARRAPRTMQDLAEIPDLMPWRRKTYGPEILKTLKQLR